jgi:tyrosyl-tRNA synthetase
MHLLDELSARGFIKQITDEPGLRERLDAGPITAYLGIDPTAVSLHMGNFLQLMLLSHFVRAGHRIILVTGAGTAMVGDPSGKSTVRKAPTLEEIERNVAGHRPLFERFLPIADSLDDGVLLVNNADWLLKLGYIDFLRDIGRHFSVNEMITAETYRRRLDNQEHLPFIEFNYRIMQAYDFLHLHREYGCALQMGGSDQWGNCVAGTELIRKAAGAKAFVLTTPLILTASGKKMGKSEQGAVWITAQHTSPWDFFQFWMNVEDTDVGRFLKLFTYMDLGEIAALTDVEGTALQPAKARLAWETTALCHSPEDADRQLAGAIRRFSLPADIVPSRAAHVGSAKDDSTPTVTVEAAALAAGIPLFQLFRDAGLAKSNGEARRLAKQGGAYVNGEAVRDANTVIDAARLKDGALLLRAGKKRYCRVVVG